ncbi:MAG: hypothetical protein Q9167_003072 [Letrouitia subvulpina]
MASSAPTATPRPWYDHFTLDLLLYVASYTIFHPFVASLLPLCLRALAAPIRSTYFIVTSAYAVFVVLCYFLSVINHRWAYGPARKVRLLDEIVVITGGLSGLGRCLAEIYALKGVGVAVLDIGVKEEGEREGIRWYRCDVSDREKLKRTWERIKVDVGLVSLNECKEKVSLTCACHTSQLGTPTVLINNAGMVDGRPFLDLTPETIEKTFQVNTLSHYYLDSLFLPPLLDNRKGGTIVTISSILGRLGASHLSAYSASKAALIAFHSALSAELRSYPNIKMILVTPGQLDTRMFEHIKLPWIKRFFGPVVEVRELAVNLVKMIDSGEGGTIAMPAYASSIAWVGILPKSMQNSMKRWSGVDTAIMAPEGQRKQTPVLKEKEVGREQSDTSDSEYSTLE